MDNQNNSNDMGGKIMWMMVICCVLPVAFIFLSGVITSKGNWVAIVIMAIFVIGYFFVMNKFHNNRGQKSGKDELDSSHGHGCH